MPVVHLVVMRIVWEPVLLLSNFICRSQIKLFRISLKLCGLLIVIVPF